jgi:hypothetical protein
MKKRILLSLVSFFAMTAMWASLIDAYKIEVSAANGKTGSTAVLTLSMDNRNAIGTWSCVLVLPEGVTFKEAALVAGRYPEGYEPEFAAVPSNGDNSVALSCSGAEGVAMTGTAGAIATVTVEIAADAPVGDCIVTVKNGYMEEPNESQHQDQKVREFKWTIEQGAEPAIEGDLNGDNKVDIADAVSVLNTMAEDPTDLKADVNGDGKVDIADFVAVLNIMAS